jgi:phosphoribosylanthranilate isomerase
MSRAQRIKFCGITDPADVHPCVQAGAWAIGAVMTPHGPRALDAARAVAVMAAVPAGIERVGVFVQATPDDVARAVEACGLTRVQLHRTDDVAGVARAAGVPVTLAIPLVGVGAIADADDAAHCDLVLFDAPVPGADGGTGVPADWGLLEQRRPARPFALAGGLTPANVGEAVRRVRPDVIDVSSGVEATPGRKDPDRVAAFADAARLAAMEVAA